MELVSIAKSKKYRKKLTSVRVFKDGIYEVMDTMLKDKEIKKHFLFKRRSHNKKTLWIIMTSDTGLCGAFNSNMLKLIKDDIRPNDLFIIKGVKGIGGMRSRYDIDKPFKTYEHYNDKDFVTLTKEVSDMAIQMFMNDEVDDVRIVWTQYINQITFRPTITEILPLTHETFENANKSEIHSSNMDITFEPDMVSILKNIIPPYINASILASLVETTLSEYSARRVAMENAKNNGEELLEILSIEYNKARQQKITQELTEIIAGAEAEKEN